VGQAMAFIRFVKIIAHARILCNFLILKHQIS